MEHIGKYLQQGSDDPIPRPVSCSTNAIEKRSGSDAVSGSRNPDRNPEPVDPAGLSVLDLVVTENSRKASIDDLSETRLLLEEVYEPFSDIVWDIVCDEIRREGWSADRLRATVIRLLRAHSYVQRGDSRPRITPRQILDAPTPRLYGRDWYMALTPTERGSVEIYDIPGRGLLYAPAGTNADLPRWDPQAARQRMIEQERRMLPEPQQEMSHETQSMLDQTKRILRQSVYIDELEQINRNLNRQLASKEARITELEQQLAEVQQYTIELEQQLKPYHSDS